MESGGIAAAPVDSDPSGTSQRRRDHDGAALVGAEQGCRDGRTADQRPRWSVRRDRVLDPVRHSRGYRPPGGQRDVDERHDRRRRRDTRRRRRAEERAGDGRERSAPEHQQPPPVATHLKRLQRRVGREHIGDDQVVLEVLASVAAVDVLRRARSFDLERRRLGTRPPRREQSDHHAHPHRGHASRRRASQSALKHG